MEMVWVFQHMGELIRMRGRQLKVFFKITTILTFQTLDRNLQTTAKSFNKKWLRWLRIKLVSLSKEVAQLIYMQLSIEGKTLEVSKGEEVPISRILIWAWINTRVDTWISLRTTMLLDKSWLNKTIHQQSTRIKGRTCNSATPSTTSLSQWANQWGHLQPWDTTSSRLTTRLKPKRVLRLVWIQWTWQAILR